MQRTVYHHGLAGVARNGRGMMAKRVFAVILAFMCMAATFVSANARKAEAMDNWVVNIVCGDDLGLNTAWQPVFSFTLNSTSDDTGYNKMSMQDVYGGRLNWTTYNGTKQPSKIEKTDGKNIFNAGGTADANNVSPRLAKDQPIHSASGDAHDFSCPVKSITSMFAGTILGTADIISTMTSLFVTSAVDPNFICQDPSQGGACINLLAVIAGDGAAGSDGGIIGRLYNGLYSGLCVLAFAMVGVWAAWTGLAKRKLTAALGGIFGAVLIFGVGVVMMNNPLLFAKLPMQIGTSLGGCVVMGVNGQNCLNTENGSTRADSKNTECYVNEDGEIRAERAMALTAKQASCKVWKAFVFEPWVAGQFGTSYDELFTGGEGSTAGPLFTNDKTKDNLSYWQDIKVGLYSADGTQASICSDTNNGYKYSNVALYQLNLMSDPTIHACNVKYHRFTSIASDGQVYGDWLWIIDAMSQARETRDLSGASNLSIMWASWSGDNYMGRFSVAFIALFASILGAAVLITTAVLAMVYLFMSVLLTAFAPLFFLIGIVPGQGKKMLLGWLEKIVSNTLKYFACILWMMVTLELYSAVLGNANSNLGMTFIFVIIVSLAMWLYRKEFLKMIGRANFGGTQMSNAVGDWMKQKADSAKDIATSTAGGAIGGMLAGRSAPKVKAGDAKPEGGTYSAEEAKRFNKQHGRLAAATDGARYQRTQALKRRSGIVGATAMVHDRITDDRRRTKAREDHATKVQAKQARDKMMTELRKYYKPDEIEKIIQATGGDPNNFIAMYRSGAIDTLLGHNVENDARTKLTAANRDAYSKFNDYEAADSDVKDMHNTAKAYGAYFDGKELIDTIQRQGHVTRNNIRDLMANPAMWAELQSRAGWNSSNASAKLAAAARGGTELSELNAALTSIQSAAVSEYNADYGGTRGRISNIAGLEAEENRLVLDKDSKKKQYETANRKATQARLNYEDSQQHVETVVAMLNMNNEYQVAARREEDNQAHKLSGKVTAQEAAKSHANRQNMEDMNNGTVDARAINERFSDNVVNPASVVAPSATPVVMGEADWRAHGAAGNQADRYGPTTMGPVNPNARHMEE